MIAGNKLMKETVHRTNQLIPKNQDMGFENGLLNYLIS